MSHSAWYVSINPRSCPPVLYESGRLGRVLNSWWKHIGNLTLDVGADAELFVEQAFRLQAAVESFGESNVWLTTDHKRAVNLGTLDEVGDADLVLAHLPRYGAQPKRGSHSPDFDIADSYASLNTFRRNAGREVHLCTNGDDQHPDLRALVLDMARRGHRKLVIKATSAKYGRWHIDLPDGASDDAVWGAVTDELSWALIHQEGVPGAWLLQEHAPMTYEYRVFVVNHRGVAGAGCIDRHTPLDHETQFDGKVAETRSPSSPVTHAPQIVAPLLNFAASVVAQAAIERPEMRDYTLDVALGPDRHPLIVEFNGLLNSGLYASDPSVVTAALHASRPPAAAVEAK